MDIPTVADILQKTYTAHHRRMLVHFKPLIEEITHNTHHQQDSTDVSRGRDTQTSQQIE
jgi:hypothetical protein